MELNELKLVCGGRGVSNIYRGGGFNVCLFYMGLETIEWGVKMIKCVWVGPQNANKVVWGS